MIKGWKNNPEWVRLYAEREKERNARLIEAMRINFEFERMRDSISALMQPLELKCPVDG